MERIIAPLRGRELSDLEEHGVFKVFCLAHEQACQFLMSYLEEEGYARPFGYREAARKAAELGLIADGAVWAEMFDLREQMDEACDCGMAAAALAADAVLARFEPAVAGLCGRFAERVASKEVMP